MIPLLKLISILKQKPLCPKFYFLMKSFFAVCIRRNLIAWGKTRGHKKFVIKNFVVNFFVVTFFTQVINLSLGFHTHKILLHIVKTRQNFNLVNLPRYTVQKFYDSVSSIVLSVIIWSVHWWGCVNITQETCFGNREAPYPQK